MLLKAKYLLVSIFGCLSIAIVGSMPKSAFADQQDDDAPEEAAYPLGAWEYHSSMKLIENSEKKPLRIFTHVAENDNRAKDPQSTYHNWVMANERTAAATSA